MCDIEIGDTVASQGTVLEIDPVEGMYRITSPDGSSRMVCKNNYQIVKPDPLRVGVKVKTGGVVGTIDETTSLYRVVADDGNVLGTFRASWLKLIPPESKPEPEYHVVRDNDELRLERIEGNLAHCCSDRVPMSNSEKVEACIREWAHRHGIDADAARKLAAEPRIIGKCPLRDGQDGPSATAIRTGNGWYVVLTAHYVLDLDSTYLPGTPLPKPIGERIFPKINGPYKVPA